MRRAVRVILAVLLFLGVVEGAALAWLAYSPPALLRVGTGYAAKIVCSNVFLAGRNPGDVLAFDIQAPGNVLLRLVGVSVDRDHNSVTARFAGFIAPQTAVARDGFGCTLLPDGKPIAEAVATPASRPQVEDTSTVAWPEGEADAETVPALAGILTNPELRGEGMRAIVVVRDGEIVGETYGAGFQDRPPLLGWSMTKTVNAALIGRMVKDGRMSLDDKGLLPAWSGDARRDITLSSLLAMESGLEFNESYGDVSDVTRMLFLASDMAGFAASKPAVAKPGTVFNYSSGTGVILSRLWMDRIGDPAAALRYPNEALFGPLGMRSAVLEPDEAGTFAGSSYMYAIARDWARFGLLLVNDGMWNGERLLPEGFVARMAEANQASKGVYSQMQTWKAGPGELTNAAAGLPDDTFWLIGHDGQSMAVIPSRKLVILRMGLTPSSLGYKPQMLAKAVVEALQ